MGRGQDKIQKQITYSDTTSTFVGTLPANAYITSIVVAVSTAFNATGNDTIDIGISTNQIYFANDIAVNSAGFASVTLNSTGAGVVSSSAQTPVYAKYIPGSTDATAGSCQVCINYAYNE